MVQKLTDYLLQQPSYAYGLNQMQEGAQTTPVYSPWQGLARALQGAVGGLSAAYGMGSAQHEVELDRTALANAMQEKDPDKQMQILATRPGNADAIQSVLLGKQTLANQEALEQYKLELGTKQRNSFFQGLGINPSDVNGVPGAAAGPAVGTGTPDPQFVQNMTPHALSVSQQTGLDPRLVIAQSALETGYGKAAPGNNYFGIKGGNGPALQTMEAGPNGQLVPTQAQFRGYQSPAESAQDYANLIKNDPHYAGVRAVAQSGGGLDAQIEAMGKSGYATDPNYAAKLRAIAQQLPGGSSPQQGGIVPIPSPGQAPAQPAANAPAAGNDMVTLRGGIQVPRAQIASMAGITDVSKLSEKMTDVIGQQIKLMTPGTPEGDAHILAQGLVDPNFIHTPQYRAAYISEQNRQTKVSQGGQQVIPQSPYPTPAGGPTVGNNTFVDTPGGLAENEQKLREEFGKRDEVKNYTNIKPVVEAAQTAAKDKSPAADFNLIAAVAQSYAPGAGALPRGELLNKLDEYESIPAQVRNTIKRLASGQGKDAESRQQLLDQIETRFGPMRDAYNATAAQYGQIAKDAGYNPAHVLIQPSASKAGGEGGGAKVRNFNPATGRLE